MEGDDVPEASLLEYIDCEGRLLTAASLNRNIPEIPLSQAQRILKNTAIE